MAAGIPARLTATHGRKFGVTVGGAFLLLSAVAWWRGRETTMVMLAIVGAGLAIAGLVIPTRLGPVERAWMSMSHAISKVTTPIVMAAMYLLVMTPTGLLRRTFGGNPLEHQAKDSSYWKTRPEGERRGSLTRQY